MDKESTNWCLLAQTIRYKGGDVLRKFLLLEILTMIFKNCSRIWMNKLPNPTKNDYLTMLWNNLNETLKTSQVPRDKDLNELLKSWTTVGGNEMALMEQLYRFKQWKNDIEEMRMNSVSSSVDIILNSWLLHIESEIRELDPTCKVLSRWNNTFHGLQQNGQKGLLFEIEKMDGFLSVCSHKLKSLSSPSCSEFQQLLQQFKRELNVWKKKCCKVVQRFCQECDNTITSWIKEAKDIPRNYAMVKFLNRLKTEIEDCNLQSNVSMLCDNWKDDMHNVFDRYERQIQDSISKEDILCLAQRLLNEVQNFSSFKDKKIRDFFSSFNPPKFPRILNIQVSDLKYISNSSDLNKLDFTILIAIWKSGTFPHTPRQDRHETLHDWDTTIIADILRLRKHRNNIIDYIAEFKISSDIFEKLWNELAILLRRIASQCEDESKVDIIIDIADLVPHRLYELRKECLTWCKTDILAQLSAETAPGCKCLNMLEDIQMALENLSRDRDACTSRSCNEGFSTEAHWCSICKVECDTELALKKHMQRHKAHFCRICNKGCYTELELEQHMENHQAHTCLICDDRFHTELELEQHLRSHLTYACGICWKGCSTYLKVSKLCSHSRNRRCHYNCNCHGYWNGYYYWHNWNYYTELDMENHLRQHQAHSCLSCSKDFPSENDLEKHMKGHQVCTVFTCSFCNKDIARGIDPYKHMRDHDDRTCCSCMREFSTDSELVEHVRNQKDCSRGTIWFLNRVFQN